MTDKEQVKISYETTVRYLMKHGVGGDCPTCGNQHSSVITDPTGAYVECVTLNGAVYCPDHSITQGTAGIAAFVIECTNCGYLRHFPFKKLFEWAKANPEEAGQ